NGLQDACFFVNGHAEFSGAGSLVLTGNVKHAFKSDEYTLIKRTTGRIEVLSAKGDGLNCGQYFEMNGGRIIVNNTKGDCIQAGITKTKTDERNGQLLVHGGTMNLNVVGEDVKGLKSDSLLTITGGTITIAAKGNGSKGISSGTDLILNAIDAVPVITITATGGQWIDPAGINNSKCMGMKVSGNLFIYAGTIDIHATGTKSKSIKVDGNLSKSANATIKVNPLYEVLGVVKDL
ncbi:MAG: carbohydrate-binding domain-containing protein, partial [Bacteroidaceae bacterium]